MSEWIKAFIKRTLNSSKRIQLRKRKKESRQNGKMWGVQKGKEL